MLINLLRNEIAANIHIYMYMRMRMRIRIRKTVFTQDCVYDSVNSVNHAIYAVVCIQVAHSGFHDWEDTAVLHLIHVFLSSNRRYQHFTSLSYFLGCVYEVIVMSHDVKCVISIPGKLLFSLPLCSLWCVQDLKVVFAFWDTTLSHYYQYEEVRGSIEHKYIYVTPMTSLHYYSNSYNDVYWRIPANYVCDSWTILIDVIRDSWMFLFKLLNCYEVVKCICCLCVLFWNLNILFCNGSSSLLKYWDLNCIYVLLWCLPSFAI